MILFQQPASEEDTDLMKYFINTKQMHQIINENKWMVLGRKGTGKTAIFKYLQSELFLADKQNTFTVSLNFKDYPWPTHKLYKDTMEGEISAYYKSWHYIIITESLSLLIKSIESKNILLSASLKNAKKIITEIYGKPTPGLLEIIKGKITRIDKLTLPSLEAGELSVNAGEISFEEISDDKKLLLSLKTNAFTLANYFEKVLIESIHDYNIIITFDQLDENWLESEIPEYSKILINLINVCKGINNDSRLKRQLKCILFLRTDIYDTLRFNDKNKIHQTSAIEIRWDEDSLNDMFFERIKRYKSESVNLDLNKKSNTIFEVNYVKHGATPFKHILRNSFYRPRDVIVFFNKIRNVYTDSKSGLYTSKDLYGAEKDFSISLYNELMDEWANQKPEIEDYLNILQNIGHQKFNFDEFKEAFLKYKATAQLFEIKNSIEFLFQNSIVGQKITANWEYICTNQYMRINLGKDFHINNGLKTRLTITEIRTKRKA